MRIGLTIVIAVVIGGIASCGAMGGPAGVPTLIPIPPPSTSPPTYTPEPTIVDRGLADGLPCKPPCWEGLTPRISTEQDVQQTLQQLRDSGQIPGFRCTQRECQSLSGVRICWDKGIVTSISGSVKFNFTVQQLVDLIGPPAAVYSVAGTSNCMCLPYTPGTARAVSGEDAPGDLFYPQLGAWFGLTVVAGETGCICPGTQVVGFAYLPPMTLGELLDVMASHLVPALRSVRESDLVEWHGFGPGYGPEK